MCLPDVLKVKLLCFVDVMSELAIPVPKQQQASLKIHIKFVLHPELRWLSCALQALISLFAVGVNFCF